MEFETTITQIVDHWSMSTLNKLLRDVPDWDVLALAAQAAILLGKRAYDCERDDMEKTCAKFARFLTKERLGTTRKSYCLKRSKQ